MDHGIDAGIKWGTIGEGMVPIFEEQLARVESHRTLEEWSCMEYFEKCILVAIKRIDTATKNHQAEAEYRKAQQEAKKGRHK